MAHPCVFCQTTNGHHKDGCPIHENVLKLGNVTFWNMGYAHSGRFETPQHTDPDYLLGFKAGLHKTIERLIEGNGGAKEA